MCKARVGATYSLRFFGPGLPRAFGVLAPSTAAALRFVPALGGGALRLLAEAGGASDEGVSAPFMAAGVSAGVSAAVESASARLGGGEASGVEAGLDGGDGCAVASWGNWASVLGGSFRTAVRVFAGLVDIFAHRVAGDVVPRWRGDGCRRW